MATKKELDQIRDAIWEKERDEQFAAQHGYTVAYERLHAERKALEEQLRAAKFDG